MRGECHNGFKIAYTSDECAKIYRKQLSEYL